MTSLLRLEVLRTLNDKRFLLLVLLMPVAMYLLFTNMPGSDEPNGALSAAVGAMISMAAFGAIGTALSATGPRIAQERANGWLRQMRITPMTGRDVITAKILAAMALALPAIVLVDVTAVIDHDVRMAVWKWLAIGGLLWAGTAPFAALGVWIGYLTSADSAFPVTYGIYLALSALGGLWMPPAMLPSALQHLARVLPSNRMAEFGWDLAAGHSLSPGGAAILTGWLLLFAALAVWGYRRTAAR
jgi:ABC-2 type transport system permease protein